MIVSEFGHIKELGLIVLFVIDKSSEIDFYLTNQPLDLAISLRVESSREPLFDFKEVA